jgi:hypothetical protein
MALWSTANKWYWCAANQRQGRGHISMVLPDQEVLVAGEPLLHGTVTILSRQFRTIWAGLAAKNPHPRRPSP